MMATWTTPHRCTADGCRAWLRPETDGQGNLRMVCDDCEKRRRNPDALTAYLFSVERRLRALEARVGLSANQSVTSASRAIVGPSRAAAAPAQTVDASPARDKARAYRGDPTLTSRILAALASSDAPLLIWEIKAAIRRMAPAANCNSVQALCHQLAAKGQIVSISRDWTRRGGPMRYALAPRADVAAPVETTIPLTHESNRADRTADA